MIIRSFVLAAVFLSMVGCGSMPESLQFWATPTPTPIAGVEVPIEVKGVSLTVDETLLAESFLNWSAEPPYNTLAIVTLLTKPDNEGVCDWGGNSIKLEWANEDGSRDSTTMGVCGTATDGSNVEFFFAAMDDGEDWELHLPEGKTIPLEIPYKP